MMGCDLFLSFFLPFFLGVLLEELSVCFLSQWGVRVHEKQV
jgi:hypothetical protein